LRVRGNCSDLTQRRFQGEGSQTLVEGIKVLLFTLWFRVPIPPLKVTEAPYPSDSKLL
jgi:hypothetical protein